MNRTQHTLLSSALLLVLCLSTNSSAAQNSTPPATYRNANLPTEQRVANLLAQMTLEEKIAQLQCLTSRVADWEKELPAAGVGGVGPVLRSLGPTEAAEKANSIQRVSLQKPRLGIPTLIHDEALHGLIGNKATSFPQAIGLAATWDTSLIAAVAAAIGKETRTRGIRQVLAPVINIARDVRWGRVEETYGEDPFLSSRIAVAYCRAIEREGVLTTPKHFVANVGDGGRDSYPAIFSERELREVYFPPFEACVREAGAGSVMAAYNSMDGLPCSCSRRLLTEILRHEWQFTGFVVSDYGSVAGIKTKHFVAATAKDAAARAVDAGLDMELPNIDFYGTPLHEAAREGLLSREALDRAVANILRIKFRLGLFEDPFVNPATAATINNCGNHRQLALKAAREAIVLLKNDRGLLPLRKDIRSIAVIGPMADSAHLGGYSGFGTHVVTPLEGIRAKLPSTTRISYAKGCDVGFASLLPIPPENLFPADGTPGQYGLRGEYFDNMEFSGPPKLVRIDKRIHFEWAMGSPDTTIPREHFSVRWTGKLVPAVSGIYTLGASTDDGVRLYLDGKLLINSWFDRGATLDVVTVRLEANRAYDIRIEYYENEGWSYASLGWELKRGMNQRIQEAVEAARTAEVAVVLVGIIEGEGYDRANLDLPGSQEELIKAVAQTGTPTTVVLVAGSAVTMKNWIDTVQAVADAWYSGERGGEAVADVLFGDYTPGGKLPITFPQFVGQVPLYYNTKPTGRGNDYADMSGKPMFPFGHGLSYTTFVYENLALSSGRIRDHEKLHIRFTLRNTGSRPGDEVVQLYLHDPVASVTRPVKELKGFQRVSLKPKEHASVSFDIGWDELSFLDKDMRRVIEPGAIEVLIGSSSEDIRLKSSFDIVRE